MNASAEIIEKIKKLLRLARSANAHEAQLAMQRALALAEEHRVTIEGLNPDEAAKEKATTHRDANQCVRLSYDRRYALAIVKKFFRVTAVEVQCLRMVDGWPTLGFKVMYVGTRSDIEIAIYVADFLTHHFAFCWREFRGRLRNRQAYVHGMLEGLWAKLMEQMPPAASPAAKGTELVLSEQEAYIAAVIGKTKSRDMGRPDHDAHAARWAGYQQGQKTEIRTALKPAEQQLALR